MVFMMISLHMSHKIFLYDFLIYELYDINKILCFLFFFYKSKYMINFIYFNKFDIQMLKKFTKKKNKCISTLVFRSDFFFYKFLGECFSCSLCFYIFEKNNVFLIKKVIHVLLHLSKFDHMFYKDLLFLINIEYFISNFLLKFFKI